MMANHDTKKTKHPHINPKNMSANGVEKICHLMSEQETNSYKLFHRAAETLILFQGCPDPKLTKLLQASNVAIGVLLSSDEFKACPSISKYSYALIGTAKDKRPSYLHAIKELSLNGWKAVDPNQQAKTHMGNNFLAIIAKQPINLNKTV